MEYLKNIINMTKFKRESRLYPYTDRFGRDGMWRVTYTIYFNDENDMIDVRNEYGHSVEKNSECWEFFNNKYN